MKKIKVMVKEPFEKPYMTEIDNTLESLQKTVGGFIETVTIASGLTIICDEEGLLTDNKYNCTIAGVYFFGTIIFAGIKGEEFADLPITEDEFKRSFHRLYKIL